MKKQNGFSLVELLSTIAIIGLLAMLAVAGVRLAQLKSKIAKAEHEIDVINTVMGVLVNDAGVWPGGQPFDVICTNRLGGCPIGNEICADGCDYGLTDPRAGLLATDGSFNNWSGPYMAQIPVDAWGNEYFFDTDYEVDANNEPCDGGAGCRNVVVIGSYGPDGQGNDQYNADDIIKIISF